MSCRLSWSHSLQELFERVEIGRGDAREQRVDVRLVVDRELLEVPPAVLGQRDVDDPPVGG